MPYELWKHHCPTSDTPIGMATPSCPRCGEPGEYDGWHQGSLAEMAIYQAVCFPIYGIPKVRRQDYLIFDRGRLRYLNTIEKVGCVYCSYANGLLAMITEVAARTERHFCPIKHARRLAHAHSQYAAFLPYGDGRAYRQQADAIENGPFDIVPKGK